MIFCSNLDRFKPIIRVLNYKHVIARREMENILLVYNVSSYPPSEIDWWKSTDGKNYQLITPCSMNTSKSCKGTPGKESITKTSFLLKDVQYHEDNAVYYKLNASNYKGNDSKTFQIQVLGKRDVVYLS